MALCNDALRWLRFPVILVANKSDLAKGRQVSEEAGRRLAERWKGAYIETSAKNKEVQALHFLFPLLSPFSLFVSSATIDAAAREGHETESTIIKL